MVLAGLGLNPAGVSLFRMYAPQSPLTSAWGLNPARVCHGFALLLTVWCCLDRLSFSDFAIPCCFGCDFHAARTSLHYPLGFWTRFPISPVWIAGSAAWAVARVLRCFVAFGLAEIHLGTIKKPRVLRGFRVQGGPRNGKNDMSKVF